VAEPVVETGIVVTAPTKVEYLVGEELDLEGLVVTVTKSDDTTEVITEGFTVTGFTSEAAGTVTVTVTYGEFTATFDVTVKKVEITANITVAADGAAEGVSVAWTDVSADAYLVYRRTYTDNVAGEWELIAEVADVAYVDTTAANGVKYGYAVAGKFGEETSAMSAEDTAMYIAAPVLTVENKAGGIKLSWEANEAANKYFFYRSEFKNGEWSAETRVSVTTAGYLDMGRTNGVLYRYRVVALKGSVQGASSEYVEILRLGIPSTGGSNDATGIKLTWAKNTAAEKFLVYRSYQKADGSWTSWGLPYAEVESGTLEYLDTEVVNGTLYRYCVRAKSGEYVSAFKDSLIIVRLDRVDAVYMENKSGSITVTWDSNPAAGKYQVIRSDYIDGKWSAWTQIGIVMAKNGCKLDDNKTLVNGAKYRYRVVAMKDTYKGGARASGEILRMPITLINSVTAKADGITVVIKANAQAATYDLQRRVVGGEWETIASDITDLTYVDTTVESGVTYEYSAIAKNGTSTSSFKQSAQVTAK
jgi:fibronectin type 3 domain-containing protein